MGHMKAEEQRTVERDAKKVVIENDRCTHKHTVNTHKYSHRYSWTVTHTVRQTHYKKEDRHRDQQTDSQSQTQRQIET